MTTPMARPTIGALLLFTAPLCITAYFTFAAVQGDYGLFRRAEIVEDRRALERELAKVQQEVARMENMTKRLSDEFLDLDLLDQQTRDVLGYVRSDEIVVR